MKAIEKVAEQKVEQWISGAVGQWSNQFITASWEPG